MACVKSSSRHSSSSVSCVSRCSRSFLSDTHTHTPLHLTNCSQPSVPTGAGPMRGRPASMGGVRAVDHAYFLSADVSQFEAPDVVVTANDRHITIHAEKVVEDGGVSDSFTHKSLLPADVDLLGVSCTLTPEGMLVISIPRLTSPHPLTFEPSPLTLKQEAQPRDSF
ncbi:heat shock protein beta-7-like [Clupea harengus]|uniref:Heat shock protein beta-7-like n=1 Tax=Clupea harengus TaxID=7950 RepID=A0A6P3VJ73_CLUHA|nr:heat shock protein beta-7-like [Clupea harengus]